jgi:WD40 repeat protein
VFSLGAVFYELLTGRAPFRGETALETMRQVLEQEPKRPRLLNQEIDADLETICLKCLQKEPEKRYGSAEAFAEDLERWQAGEPVQARPSTGIERMAKWARRKPALAALAGVSCLALVALVAAGAGLHYNGKLRLAFEAADNARSAEAEARRKEEQQRRRAEDASKAANDARAAEAVQRVLVEQTLSQVRRAHYARSIALAERELLANNGTDAELLLDECPSDLRSWEWNYLKRLCYFGPTNSAAVSRVVRSESTEMYDIAFNSDGTQLACLGNNGVLVVDPVSGVASMERFTSTRHKSRVAFSSRANLIAFGQDDITTVVHDLGPDNKDLILDGGATDVAFSPIADLLATCNVTPNRQVGGMTVKIWRTDRVEAAVLIGESTNGFTAVLFSPDGRWLAAAESRLNSQVSYDKPDPNFIRVWDVESKKLIQTLEGHRFSVWKLAFTPDAKRLVSVSGLYFSDAPGEVKVWDTESGRELLDLKGHGYCVFGATISPDGRRLATAGGATRQWGGSAEAIRIWDLSDGIQVMSLKEESGMVYGVAFSPCGRFIATANKMGTVRIWDGTPAPAEHFVEWTGHHNAEVFEWRLLNVSDLTELRAVPQRLAGVRFNVRGIVQLGSSAFKNSEYPPSVYGIAVNVKCSRLHFLHAAINEMDTPDGAHIGSYVIHYSDGSERAVAIIFGRDVASFESDKIEKKHDAVIAWTGANTRNDRQKRLFKTTWENPQPDVEVKSIDFVSTHEVAAPFLVAITAQ